VIGGLVLCVLCILLIVCLIARRRDGEDDSDDNDHDSIRGSKMPVESRMFDTDAAASGNGNTLVIDLGKPAVYGSVAESQAVASSSGSVVYSKLGRIMPDAQSVRETDVRTSVNDYLND